ncbi:MAG: cell wall hydrolase [Clostridium sp.]|nr:cell wall hydrolase [Clostridium sp.]
MNKRWTEQKYVIHFLLSVMVLVVCGGVCYGASCCQNGELRRKGAELAWAVGESDERYAAYTASEQRVIEVDLLAYGGEPDAAQMQGDRSTESDAVQMQGDRSTEPDAAQMQDDRGTESDAAQMQDDRNMEAGQAAVQAQETPGGHAAADAGDDADGHAAVNAGNGVDGQTVANAGIGAGGQTAASADDAAGQAAYADGHAVAGAAVDVDGNIAADGNVGTGNAANTEGSRDAGAGNAANAGATGQSGGWTETAPQTADGTNGGAGGAANTDTGAGGGEAVSSGEDIEAAAEQTGGRVIAVSDEDYEALLRIVQAEAGNEDTKGKILVANVVLNRVVDERFPNSVYEVVFQRAGGKAQFSPVASGSYYKVVVSQDTVEAVERALAGEDYSEGALYFAARRYAGSSQMRWFDECLTKLFSYGGHEFFTS